MPKITTEIDALIEEAKNPIQQESIFKPKKIEFKNTLKDYSIKLKNKLPDNINSSDINEFISLLNYCFLMRNNFFVPNFNKKSINFIYLSYNKIKTNILTQNINNIFEDISSDNIKLLRFILINFVNNYQEIFDNNQEICKHVRKESMQHLIHYLSKLLIK